MKKLIVILMVIFLASCTNKSQVEPVSNLENETVETMHIISFKGDDRINSVDDIYDKNITISRDMDSLANEEAKDYLVNDLGLSPSYFIESPTYRGVARTIMDGDSDLALINDKYLSDLDNYITNFNNDIKIIHTFEVSYETPETKHSFLEKPFNVLLVGTDDRFEPNEQRRTDVIQVLSVNPVTKNVTIIGLPRDTYIAGACSNGKKTKLTHFGYHGGPECVRDTVSEYFDIEIDYYAQLSFKGFVDFIEHIGGIKVNVIGNFCEQNSFRATKSFLQCLKNKGKPQDLNGEQALALARHRKTTDGGDLGRIKNQQLIINAIIDKFAENPNHALYINTINKIDELVYTNFSFEDKLALLTLAMDFGNDYTIDNYNLEATYVLTSVYDLSVKVNVAQVTEDSLEIAKLKLKYNNNLISKDELTEEQLELVVSTRTEGATTNNSSYKE